MAKLAQKPQDDTKSAYETPYKADYQSDWDIHRNYINQNFDSYEAMLIGQVFDSVSGSVDSSKITDSYATTLAKERADRVMAKLPEGQVEPIGSADVGKAAFMDILRQKWIYPNANAQHPFFEKLNMWQFYSSVYGYMPMFYDWNVSLTGYVGPDCWLWNPRNLIPQQGRASIADMEYVTALTWVNKSYIEGIIEDNSPGDAKEDAAEGEKDNKTAAGGWDIEALQELLESADKLSGKDANEDTKIARDRSPSSVKRGIKLATRYEAGEDGQWVTFAPDHGYCEVRRIDNPHKNGRIPFVIKYSQPLFDSFYGLGDFQRAKPLQFARDGLVNFYFRGIKMNLIPPIVANANGVVKHTLDYREGGVMLETIPNSIRRLETSTAGLATYQAAQTSLTGSLLAQFGSQNASAPGMDSTDPSQGKTPQAINLYSEKEATRDGSERRHIESAIEQLTERFFSLIANIGTEDIPVTLFSDDIKQIIKSGLKDVNGLFTKKNFKPNASQTAADLVINPAALKGVEYRFKINPDSTAKINQQAQLQSILDLMDKLGKYQNILQEDPTITIHWDKIMSTYASLTAIPGADEFITFDPNATPPPPPPSQTAVSMPGGQVHELADLGKMFASMVEKPGYEDVQNAVLQTMGIQAQVNPQPAAAPEQQPAVSDSGHSFNNPHLADVANKLFAQAQPTGPQGAQEPPEAPQPIVSKSGHSFADPHLAEVANALHEQAQPVGPQGAIMPEEQAPAEPGK